MAAAVVPVTGDVFGVPGVSTQAKYMRAVVVPVFSMIPGLPGVMDPDRPDVIFVVVPSRY
jgi:hypothetical protein